MISEFELRLESINRALAYFQLMGTKPDLDVFINVAGAMYLFLKGEAQ